MTLAGGAIGGQHFAAMQHAETSRLRVVALAEPRRDEAGGPTDSSTSDSGLPSPGRYIAEQRTRQGLSIDQLAAATKIPRSSLEFLENDQHDALPGPVFVKGFLRCCARSLGVEAETVMELVYERERALLMARRKERPQSSALPAPHARTPKRLRKAEPAESAKSESSKPKSGKPKSAKSKSGTSKSGTSKSNRSKSNGSKSAKSEADFNAASEGGRTESGTPEHAASATEQPPLFSFLTRFRGASAMLWVAVALFVGMVMMAAFNVVSLGGPTLTTLF